MTQAGMEPATFRFVAQHLNHCAAAVPKREMCVMIFSTDLSETFLILKRMERDTTKNVNWSSKEVLVILVRN